MRLLRFVFFILALATLARAQSAQWEPNGGTLAYNQVSELSLVFLDCEPTGEPALPSVSGLTLQAAGRSESTNIFNTTISRVVSHRYLARTTTRNRITIPSFTVPTNKGTVTVAAASFDVGQATVGQNRVSLDTIATSRIVHPREAWAGEVFPLSYTLTVARRYFHQFGSNLEWDAAPFAIEEWAKPDLFESAVNGEDRVVYATKTRALLRQPGDVAGNAATQLVNIQTGAQAFGFFNRPNLDQFVITSNRPQITVKPLPAGAPASFDGAVGQFTLESKVVPLTAAVGEPLTWTLTLTGTGNWPDVAGLPAREASKDFRVVQPQAKRTPKEGMLYDATLAEDVVLIPTKAGRYTLGGISWSYFDPAKGSYETIKTAPITVTVTAAAAPAAAPQAVTPGNNAAEKTAPPKPVATAPVAPAPIPRDPLPGSADVPAPLSSRNLMIALLAPLPLLLTFWFQLALRRAKATDPLRPQREARTRLTVTLAKLRGVNDPAKVAALLQDWQRDVAVLWILPHAVPAATLFETRAAGNPQAQAWAALWREAERSLYAANTPLPADWITRAEAATAAYALRPFSTASLFRPRNLLPFAAALALALAVFPEPVQAAETSIDAYNQGKFADAEKSLRERIAGHPTDWIARHNLALALAQQGRTEEAAGQAVASFVQQPGNASVRWHFSLTQQSAGYAPVGLSAFNKPTPLHDLASRFSPARWQHLLILASWLAALAIAALVSQGYGKPRRWIKVVSLLALFVSVTGGALAAVNIYTYRPAHDARAVIVWRAATLRSIPTEADTTQKTSPLAAGSLAIAEKDFLGWTRLAFRNGQTGWVRKEDVVALWR
jgi:hypothetical protein